MNNPFDNENGTYVVLANEEGQHSLWPAFAETPVGWSIVHPEGSRQSCLAYIEEHWTDQRPKSLVDAVNRAGTDV